MTYLYFNPNNYKIFIVKCSLEFFMKMNWAIYSIIAAISFAGMILVYKKLLLLGINQNLLNFYIFGLVFLGFASVVFINKTPIKLSYLMMALLVLASIFSLIGNFSQVKAYATAPNPGYASTLAATQLVLVSILSVLFFRADFSWIKFLGILVVILGSYLVSS